MLRTAFVFCVAILGLLGATYRAWETVPALASRVENISIAEKPRDSHYLAHDRNGHLDHYVLYHGIDRQAIANLKRAQILFVGTSRLMFALRSRILRPWAREKGLTYYALGFGMREGDTFTLDLIRKHDLRPELVVVNVDGFFARELSEWAERVVSDTAFGARRQVWEAQIAHEGRRLIHRVIPNWIDLYGRPGLPSGGEFIAYRSRSDGTWSISPWPEAVMPAPSQDFFAASVGPRIGDPARAFKQELDRRGARMILTYVPTPDDSGGNPVALGDLLGVPVVGMDVDGLTSSDGSHLSELSAAVWTKRLIDDLTPYLPRPR